MAKLKDIDKRIDKIEKSRKYELLKLILTFIAGAIVALVGHWLTYKGGEKERELKKAESQEKRRKTLTEKRELKRLKEKVRY